MMILIDFFILLDTPFRHVFVYHFPTKIMSLFLNSKKSVNETLESLRHICSIELYKKNPKHGIFELSENSESLHCSSGHNFKYFEEKYGDATMILRICRKGDFSDAEIFPPRKKRIVLTH